MAADAAGGALPAVWILHGQPDSSATWWPTRRRLLDTLAAAGRVAPEVRIPDRPGYGHNLLPATGFEGNVAWLRAELDRSGVQRVVLAGHSWGGGVAALAAVADERVAGVMLLASVGPHCLIAADQLFTVPGLGVALSWAALGPGSSVWRRRVRERVLTRLDPADLPFARSAARADRARPVWRSFVVEQRALLRELTRLDAAWPELQVPVLVVAGREDRLVPAATPAALIARIPHAERVDLDAGHDLNLAVPHLLADTMAAWLLRQAW